MRKDELALRLLHACTDVIMAEDELTELDVRLGLGTADLGATMVRVVSAISQAVVASEGSIQEMLDAAATEVSKVAGGRAVPLWSSWLDGLQEAAPDDDVVSVEELRAMFEGGTLELMRATDARVGDKTMMDAFVPVSEAAAACEGDELDLFDDAADAAEAGAESTCDMVAKFGPAAGLGEGSRGTVDPGALAVAHFFRGLSRP